MFHVSMSQSETYSAIFGNATCKNRDCTATTQRFVAQPGADDSTELQLSSELKTRLFDAVVVDLWCWM